MSLSADEINTLITAKRQYLSLMQAKKMSLEVRYDFATYRALRQQHGERHLNQAFDPRHAEFGEHDFWLLARNSGKEPIATYCLRRFVVADFYELIGSLALWFSKRRRAEQFVFHCRIPPFGGEIAHGGGLWVRPDHRGSFRLAEIMPRLARVMALSDRPFDHDTAMIRNDPSDGIEIAERKAVYMGRKIYGFSRVQRFANGWFPPERRNAIMHLCHATRAEALVSLRGAPQTAGGGLPPGKFGKVTLVDQHDQPVHAPAVLRERQQQPSV